MSLAEQVLTAIACIFVFGCVVMAHETGRQQTTIKLRSACDADPFDLKPEFYQPIKDVTP